MRVMRVASCCVLRVDASTFPLLLLLFYCYLLFTASFCSPGPSPATRLRTFFIPNRTSSLVACIFWITDRWIKAAWIMDRDYLVEMGTVVRVGM